MDFVPTELFPFIFFKPHLFHNLACFDDIMSLPMMIVQSRTFSSSCPFPHLWSCRDGQLPNHTFPGQA